MLLLCKSLAHKSELPCSLTEVLPNIALLVDKILLFAPDKNCDFKTRMK